MGGGGLPPPTSTSKDVAFDGPIPPFPLAKAVILSITVVNESLCANMLLPFIGLFVAHLQGRTAEEAGFASGFLVAVFQLGQVVAGKRWGHLSDKYGRKPALQGGLICSGIIMFLFGLSPSIYMSILLRFLHGLANGNVLVAKAMVPEVMGHKAHEAKGYTIPSLTWCLGTLIGPAIGGALYDPTRYGWFPLGPESIFGTNPALLPSLVIGCYSFFALTVCTLFLEETNVNAKPPQLPCFRDASESKTVTDVQPVHTPSPTTPKTKFGYKQAFGNPLTRVVLILYMVISFCDIAFFEILPLWAVAGRSYGGLSMASETVGLVILINGLPGMCANLLFSTALEKAGGPIQLFRIGIVIWAAANLALPFAHLFEDQLSCLAALSVILTTRVLGAAWCFSTTFLLIGRSAPTGHLGSINGIGQAVGCMTRTLAPLMVAPMFAWSIEKPRSFPFNYHLAFLIGWVPLAVNYPLLATIAKEPAVLGLPHPQPKTEGTILEIDNAPNGGDFDDCEKEDGVLNSTFSTSLQHMQYEDLARLSSTVDTKEDHAVTMRNVAAEAAKQHLRLSPPPPHNPSSGHPPRSVMSSPPPPAVSRNGSFATSLPRRMVVIGTSPCVDPELILVEAEEERPNALSI